MLRKTKFLVKGEAQVTDREGESYLRKDLSKLEP